MGGDHVGANPELHRRFGVSPIAHPLALPRLAQPETVREMPWYRRVYWGLVPEGAALDAVTRQLAGTRRPIAWFSLGDYNRRNLVEGLIKGLI